MTAEGGRARSSDFKFDAGGNRIKQTSSHELQEQPPLQQHYHCFCDNFRATRLIPLAMLDLLFLMHQTRPQPFPLVQRSHRAAGDRTLIGIGGKRPHVA